MSYDIIVLGCGSAGSRAAAAAAAAGARVLAIESGEQLGGLCILRGCMPTKTLLETAHRLHDIHDAERFGIRVARPQVDFPAQMSRMRQLVDRFRKAKEGSIAKGGYELRRGAPRFVGPNEIELDGERIGARAFVIATGSRVRPMPGAAEVAVHTSDDMFLLEAPPRRAVVFGAGAVGLEFATWLARMGSEVTLSVRSPLLHRTDAEFGEELGKALAEEMTVRAGTVGVAFTQRKSGIEVTLQGADGPEEIEVDLVLNATGRDPALGDLDVEKAGLELSGSRLNSNENLQTSRPHIFVAGDAAAKRPILHEANREGQLAGANAARVAGVLDGELEAFDLSVPECHVIFTDPAFATTGLTRRGCEAAGIPYRDAVKRFPEQGRGIVTGARYGMVRLITHAETRHVLGCQILNARADDLIHIPAAVITLGGTVDDMFRVPWYHPTLAEAFIEVCRELL